MTAGLESAEIGKGPLSARNSFADSGAQVAIKRRGGVYYESSHYWWWCDRCRSIFTTG